MSDDLELLACTPSPLDPTKFNCHATIPYDLTIQHIQTAMQEFLDFLGFLNQQLHGRDLSRLECIMMPANFSSLVGEFVIANIPKHCATLVKNAYHNGHPDLVPASHYPGNSVQHGDQGIEVKGSRYSRGWQGHNAEECWLMVLVYASNRPADKASGTPSIPFCFKSVFLGRLETSDWKFSGRSDKSRRTITASVVQSGRKKMVENWVYREDAEEDDEEPEGVE
jgi:hypothetical protein